MWSTPKEEVRTYNVFGGTLNLAQSNPASKCSKFISVPQYSQVANMVKFTQSACKICLTECLFDHIWRCCDLGLWLQNLLSSSMFPAAPNLKTWWNSRKQSVRLHANNLDHAQPENTMPSMDNHRRRQKKVISLTESKWFVTESGRTKHMSCPAIIIIIIITPSPFIINRHLL